MKLLLDTHVLVWMLVGGRRLSRPAFHLITDPGNQCFFSISCVWEVAIKAARGKQDFLFEAAPFRSRLLELSFRELLITSDHVFETSNLPHIHRDPFDRILIAQAIVEGMSLLTADDTLLQYPGPILKA